MGRLCLDVYEKNVRVLAANIMLVSGIPHLGSVVLVKFEPASIISPVFGVAYLVVGYFLLRSGRKVLWWGAAYPFPS